MIKLIYVLFIGIIFIACNPNPYKEERERVYNEYNLKGTEHFTPAEQKLLDFFQ